MLQKFSKPGMVLLAFSLWWQAVPAAEAATISDAEVRALLVKLSIASYYGNCPCPDYLDKAGHRCGKRSAYSKIGGASPLCYESDVTDQMIQRYRSAVR